MSSRLTCPVVMLTLLLPGATSPAFARLRPGIEAGLDVSSLHYDENFPFVPWDKEWRTSFTGGATLEIMQHGRFTLVSGLRYVQQGNRVKFDTGPDPLFQLVGEFRIVQNYLAVPALVELRLLGSRRLFVSLGPEIGFLLSGRLIVEETEISGGRRDESTEYRNIRDDLDPTDVTLDAGTGFEFPMENHVGVVQIRYTHGLTGVAKKDQWFSDWKTRGVEVIAGVRW
jgi:outer membrane protein with beta-barrel domain